MAASAAQSVARQLGSLLVEEARFLYGVEEKVEELQQELAWMQGFLEDVDTRQHHEELIRMWVSQVRDLAYKAEDVVEMYIHKVQHRSGGEGDGLWDALKRLPCILAHARTIHNVGSQIDGLTQKILKLNTRLKSYGVDMRRVEDYSVQYASRLRDLRQTYSHTVDKDLIRRDKDIKRLVDQLLVDHQNSVVGVVGMGGLGKTTLVREVLRDEAIKDSFGGPAWVYVSQQPNKRRVLHETLRALKPEEEDVAKLSDEQLSDMVSRVLKERRCLVVLDDIWYEGTWTLLEHVFSRIKETESKLLLTTRNGDVVRKVDPNAFVLKPPCLNAQESWTLLLKKAFPGSNVHQLDPRMEQVGKRMLKHCDGLPMAIVSLGGALATKKTIDEWEAVENNIGKHFTKCGIGKQDAEIGVTQVLELSYNDLPFYLKPCFLCFMNFPEDYEIPTDLLYQLWQAEGLVQLPEENQARTHLVSIYDVAEQYLNMLVIRCLVEVGEVYSSGRIKTCRIHDMMREMCLSKSKQEKFLEIVVEDDLVKPTIHLGRCHRVAVHLGNDERSAISFFNARLENALKLRSLVVHTPTYTRIRLDTWSSKISKAFVLLRVLRLEGFAIEELPQDLGKCVHVRYLSMWLASDLKASSVVWKLSYLQTLDLQGSKPDIRIANKLWRLKRLLHLYLPSKYQFANEKMQLSNASQMETLVNINIRHLDEQRLQKMTNLRLLSFQPIQSDLVDFALLNSVTMNPKLVEQPQLVLVPLEPNYPWMKGKKLKRHQSNGFFAWCN